MKKNIKCIKRENKKMREREQDCAETIIIRKYRRERFLYAYINDKRR
jgi:hypothetical protein